MKRKLQKLLLICLISLETSCARNTIGDINCKIIKPIHPKCLEVGKSIRDINNEWDTEDTCKQIDYQNQIYEIVEKLCYKR